jgi:hypothetical protein
MTHPCSSALRSSAKWSADDSIYARRSFVPGTQYVVDVSEDYGVPAAGESFIYRRNCIVHPLLTVLAGTTIYLYSELEGRNQCWRFEQLD